MANELALIQNPSSFLPSAAELAEVSAELKGVMTRQMLGTIQIANGGAGVFKVKEPGADEAVGGIQSVEGVILASHDMNVLWGSDFGHHAAGELPVCRSVDGQTGIITENGATRACATCPYNQFVNNRKPCVNKRQLYIMREGDLVPMIFSLSPASKKYFDKYLVRARLELHTPVYALVTRITLRNERNGSNEYSVPVFTPVGKLPREDAKRLAEYAQAFAAAAQRNGIQTGEPSARPAQPQPAPESFTATCVEDEDLPFDV